MTTFKHSLQDFFVPAIKINKYDLARIVSVFARQLMRHDADLTLSDAMIYAWDEMLKFGSNYRLIKFAKTNGEIVQRIVMAAPAHEFIPVKGNGRPLNPGQMWFADAARLHTGKRNASISTYHIIEQYSYTPTMEEKFTEEQITDAVGNMDMPATFELFDALIDEGFEPGEKNCPWEKLIPAMGNFIFTNWEDKYIEQLIEDWKN